MRNLPSLHRKEILQRGTHIHGPQLALAVILLKHLVVAVLFLAILLRLGFRVGSDKRDLFRILRPVERADIAVVLRKLPRFSAFRRDQPELMGSGFVTFSPVLFSILL